MNDHLPPAASESERAVLSALLCEPERFGEVSTITGAIDFYQDGHRGIFGIVAALRAEGAPVDPVSVKARAEATGQLERIGGGAYIGNLMDSGYVPANAVFHARIVAEKAADRRRLDATAAYQEAVISRNGAGPGEGREAIDAAALRLREALDAGSEAGFTIEPIRLADHGATTIPPALFGTAGGDVSINAGDVVIVAAEAGTGKTLFALDAAIARTTGAPFLGFPSAGKGRALVVAADGDGEAVIAARTVRLARGRGLDPASLDGELFVAVPDGLCLDVPRHLAALRALVKRIDPDLIVLDSLNALAGPGVDLQKDAQAAVSWIRTHVRVLQPRPDGSRRTIIILHHLRKLTGERGGNALRDRIGGSYGILAAVDCALGLESTGPETFTCRIVKPSRSGARFGAFLARISGAQGEPLTLETLGALKQPDDERIADDTALADAVAALAGPDRWARSDAVKARLGATTPAKVRAFNRTVNRAVKAATLERHPSRKGLVRLAPAPESPDNEAES